MSTRVQKKAAKLQAESGLRAADRYLQKVRDDLMLQVREVDSLIDLVRDDAVLQGLAIMVPGNPRELAPTKEAFIKAFGITVWNRMKRLSKASKSFIWKEDVEQLVEAPAGD